MYILTISAPGPRPIIGYRISDGMVVSWTRECKYHESGAASRYDIVFPDDALSYQPRFWVNMYGDGTKQVHMSKEDALAAAAHERQHGVPPPIRVAIPFIEDV